MINLQKAEFLRSAADVSGFPAAGTPQIVFAGRSNVGKSSVINCLLNRKNLARTSSTPGKTANINIYAIDGKLYFVDLPGYGFAQVGHREKARWGKLMDSYFGACRDISLGILVVDMRHKPTADDVAMAGVYRSLEIPFIVCANKADKPRKSDLAACKAQVLETLEVAEDRMIPFSAAHGTGRDALLGAILAAVEV